MVRSGDTYHIYKLGIPLYSDSVTAAKRSPTPNYVTFTGETIVDYIAWTDDNGNWYYPNQGAGTIPIYSIRDKTKSYGIGWIRSDDNTSPTYVKRASTLIVEASRWDLELHRTIPNSTTKIDIYVNNVFIKSETTDKDSVVVRLGVAERNKIYSALSNVTTGEVKLTAHTIVGGQTIAKEDRLATVQISEVMKPYFTEGPTIKTTGEVSGKLYKDASKVSVKFKAAPGQGTTIARNRIEIGSQGFDTNEVNEIPLNQAGQVKVRAIAIDGRARKIVWEETLTVNDYSKPAVSDFFVRRKESQQTTAVVSAVGQYDESISGIPMYVIEYKKKSDQNWISDIPRQVDKGLTPGTWKLVTEKKNLSTNETFDFRLRLIDTKGFIVTAMQSLGTEYLPLDLGKFGIGVGRIFDNDTPVDLQVGKGGIDSEGPIKIGGIPINSGPSEADIQSMVNNGLKGLIEYGSSSNGHWIRLFDGTQICWISGLERTPKWMDDYKNSGGLWRTDSLWWKLPKPFKDNNFFAQISSDEMIGTGKSWAVWYTTFKSSNVDWVGYNGWSFTFQSDIKLQKLRVRGFAIGRWK